MEGGALRKSCGGGPRGCVEWIAEEAALMEDTTRMAGLEAAATAGKDGRAAQEQRGDAAGSHGPMGKAAAKVPNKNKEESSAGKNERTGHHDTAAEQGAASSWGGNGGDEMDGPLLDCAANGILHTNFKPSEVHT